MSWFCPSYGFTDVHLRYGLDIEVPGASILSSFGFINTALWQDVICLAIFGGTSIVLRMARQHTGTEFELACVGTFILLAYIAMHLLLVEKR
jgi:hypothetical protein